MEIFFFLTLVPSVNKNLTKNVWLIIFGMVLNGSSSIKLNCIRVQTLDFTDQRKFESKSVFVQKNYFCHFFKHNPKKYSNSLFKLFNFADFVSTILHKMILKFFKIFNLIKYWLHCVDQLNSKNLSLIFKLIEIIFP